MNNKGEDAQTGSKSWVDAGIARFEAYKDAPGFSGKWRQWVEAEIARLEAYKDLLVAEIDEHNIDPVNWLIHFGDTLPSRATCDDCRDKCYGHCGGGRRPVLPRPEPGILECMGTAV